jgi:hypothetical protein
MSASFYKTKLGLSYNLQWTLVNFLLARYDGEAGNPDGRCHKTEESPDTLFVVLRARAQRDRDKKVAANSRHS